MVEKSNTVIRMVKSTSVFFIGNVISKLMIFFLLPIYTKFIPTNDFGYYDLSITYITVATSVLFLDIWVSTMRYMYDGQSVEWKNKVISSGWKIFTISSSIYVFLSIILGLTMNIKYLVYICAYGLLQNISTMYTFIARGYSKNIDFAISGILNTLALIVINIFLIVGLKRDFSSLYIAGILGNIIQVLYLEKKIHILNILRWKKYDKYLTKEVFLYTLPLCVNSVAYWLLTSYNKVVISKVLSTSYNGIYAIGSKFALAVSLFASCFTFAWQDVSFSRGKDDGEFYSKACRLYLIFLGAGTTLLISSFSIVFPLMVNKAYWTAKGTIPLFLVTTVISSYSTFVGNIFYAIKDTKTIFLSMIASCGLNLVLCHKFIQLWGLNGANISIAASFILNITIRYFVLKKKISFSFDAKSACIIVSFIGVSMIMYAKYNMLMNLVWMVVSGICILIIFREDVKSILCSIR